MYPERSTHSTWSEEIAGETEWKESMKAENDEARIGNTNTEAFAHLVLQNNYFSWLYEIKQRRNLKDLLTEYDSASKVKDKKHLVDIVLENIELDPDSMKVLLESHDGEDYKEVRDLRLQAARASAGAKRKNSCMAVLKTLEEKVDKENNGSSEGARKLKRRKLLRQTKMFTGSKENVRKAKGWNDEGHRTMVEIAKKIREDEKDMKYKAFDKAARLLYRLRHKSQKTQEEVIEAYRLDLSCVWDFDDEEEPDQITPV